MVKSQTMKLVSVTYQTDDIGNQIPKELLREVFCNVKSTSQSEFFKAGEAGLKPTYKFTMFRYDYSGEKEVEYLNERYSVYRTYAGDSDDIELYVTEKVGV